MVSPVSLSNMEYQLYGGTSGYGNINVPSASNGYQMQSPYLNQSYYPSQIYQQSPYYQQSQPITQGAQGQLTQSNVPQSGVIGSQRDWNTIADYYVKSNSPSESLMGAAGGGVLFGFMNNPRLIVHPWNSIKSLKPVEQMFKGVKSGGVLNDLWKNKETNNLMREAYFRMHKIEARHNSKIGLFRKKISDAEYNQLKDIMDKALKSGNKEQIAEATAKLEHAYVNDGWIPKTWNKLKSKLGFKTKSQTVAERLSETGEISKKAGELLKNTNASLSKSVKEAFKFKKFAGSAGLWVGLEFLMNMGTIKSAFDKDSSTGWKQIGQTAVKGAGSAIGWTLGEAVGAWGATKIGAMLGTAIAPGVGTAIGGILGLVGGSIGMWAMGKLTKALVGEDVGKKAEAEQMTKTPEGQAQLLQYTLSQAQKGENISPTVAMSVQNIANQYNAVA